MTGPISFPRKGKTISLTPLIDVVFILLMFFMLTSTFAREKQLSLTSPTAGDPAKTVAPREFWLSPTGILHNAGEPGEQVADAELLNLSGESIAIIRPYGETPVQTIVTTLIRLKASGLDSVTLGAVLAFDNPGNTPGGSDD